MAYLLKGTLVFQSHYTIHSCGGLCSYSLYDKQVNGDGKQIRKGKAFSWFRNLLFLKTILSRLDIGLAYYEDPERTSIFPLVLGGPVVPIPAHFQWSTGKLVLILDTVYWNLEANHKRYRTFACGAVRHHPIVPAANSDVSMKKEDVSGFFRRTGNEELCWAEGREKALKGSQCFFVLNEMRQPRDALLLTPQGSEMELNLSLS
ncbi:hypothetical protein ACH5RR_029494 [Cinchona calisaya]|uniref:Uncharacterized protein n=1 Tax=Cinchona calisaya TaxID=153742 RepID=A0ABD2YX14_9GENT